MPAAVRAEVSTDSERLRTLQPGAIVAATEEARKHARLGHHRVHLADGGWASVVARNGRTLLHRLGHGVHVHISQTSVREAGGKRSTFYHLDVTAGGAQQGETGRGFRGFT